MNTRMQTSEVWGVLAGVLLTACMARGQGIPEPGLTMYGVIRNDIGGAKARMTSGTLTWTIRPSGGPPVTVSTSIRNINDQFSYVLDVPFESPVAGASLSSNTLPLRATAVLYDRSCAAVGTNAAVILTPAETTFLFSQADRAGVQRVDLQIAARDPDRDGDGLPDWWEDAFFSGIADPGEDDDGDGLSNRQEYLAGTDPTDWHSAFSFVDVVEQPSKGFVIRWSSMAGRYYRIGRSGNLLTGFSPLVSGLPATPPVNTYTDAAATNGGPWFYRVEVE